MYILPVLKTSEMSQLTFNHSYPMCVLLGVQVNIPIPICDKLP